ncbi:hypothetical protein HK096_005937 [Nowakowskiella sp. JEL0078]|nr:hypothetical protein HK096_005937 [Nowakowskiella sp. JEL0078]
MRRLYRKQRLHGTKWFIGASTGALRFVAFISSILSKRNHTRELKEHFCNMVYHYGDSPNTLRPQMEALYRICLPTDLIDAVLGHEQFKIAIMVADFGSLGLTGVLAGAILNTANPNYISRVLKRVCFYSGSELPSFLENGVGGKDSITFCKLTKDNVYQVFHATTCVPFVQVGGLLKCFNGYFADGAFCDYMLNVKLEGPQLHGLILGDYPENKVKATFFDLHIPWRTIPESFRECVSVVCPSKEFLSYLPEKKLPSISDWFSPRYISNPAIRQDNWRVVYNLSLRNLDERVFFDGWKCDKVRFTNSDDQTQAEETLFYFELLFY